VNVPRGFRLRVNAWVSAADNIANEFLLSRPTQTRDYTWLARFHYR
jgi:hypothetical protein